VLAQDYRVHAVTPKKSLYLTICHVSPLKEQELGLSPDEIIGTTFRKREWETAPGKGAAYLFSIGGSPMLIPPPGSLDEASTALLSRLALEDYKIPLSYSLILEADKAMLVELDYRLAIVHAATAVEVHVMNMLHALLVETAHSINDAWELLENDPAYNGTKPRLKKLDQLTRDYCAANTIPMKHLLGTTLYDEWETKLWKPRNRAVHAGFDSFIRNDAFDGIRAARRVVAFIESRIPKLRNQLQFDGSMNSVRDLP
jgi:hypothetical protein